MKKFNYLIAIIAFIGLLLVGCSEKTQLPNEPTKNEPVNSLEKAIITNFTAVNYPTGSVDPGEQKIVGGNLILRNMILLIRWDSDNPLIASDGIGIFNSNADAVTGEGHYWGKVTLTPDEGSDGEWDITWTGNCTQTGQSEWTVLLKIVGHGRGGSINGMHLFADNTAVYDEPFPSFWISNVTGYIKSTGK